MCFKLYRDLEGVKRRKMAIKTTIENGKVSGIEVGNIQLFLKQDVSFEDLPKVIEGLDFLGQFIDFSKIAVIKIPRGEWHRDEIFSFLDKRNEQQITFFQILADTEEISRKYLVTEMGDRLNKSDFKGLTLAGILSGIGTRTNRLNKEKLYEKNRKIEGTNYRLNEKYASIVKEWLKSHFQK